MKITAPAIATITLGLAAAAWAQTPPAGMPSPDADHDGTVTRAEMQAHAAAMFDRMDANKDGRIDAADREARMATMFDRIDTSHDGQISRDEFMAHHQPAGHAAAQNQRMQGHGMMMGYGMKKGRGMGMMMLHMADANKDGVVTRDEFMTASSQHFDRVDANRNGEISREERRAAHQAMGKKMRAGAATQAHDHGSAD